MENEHDQPIEDLLAVKIRGFLTNNYKPEIDSTDRQYLSTSSIFESLQQLYPSHAYSAENVATWLSEAGFKFKDMGALTFLWELREQ